MVIPTRNRPELLGRCLAALGSQSADSGDYEVVVVADGPQPAVATAVNRHRCNGTQVRLLATAAPAGPAAARNLGWRSAAGDIIAFTDDDCIPTRGWIREIQRACSLGADGGWGSVVVPHGGELSDYQNEVAKLGHCEFVTANCFCRRGLLEVCGGFDERFRDAWREDSDLYFKLIRDGAKLMHFPEASVIHPIRPAAWGVSLRQQRKAMYNALLFKNHPRLYRQKVETSPPLLYYGIAAALVLSLSGVLRFHAASLALGFILWATLSGAFVMRRLRDTSRRPAHILEIAATSLVIPLLSIFWRLYGAYRFKVRFA